MTNTFCPRFDVSFGGLALDRLPYVTDVIDMSTPSVLLQKVNPFMREGSIISDSRRGDRTIQMRGRIVSQTPRSSMEIVIDRLNRALMNGRQVLKPGYSDSRYFYATLSGPVTVDWQEGDATGGGQHSPRLAYWQASFLADTAYAYAPTALSVVDNTPLLLDSGTSYHKDIVVTPTGSAPARPRFTLTIPSTYGISIITLTNLTTGTTITIKRAFLQGDIVSIDTDTYAVYCNLAPIDFAGALNMLIDPQVQLTNTIRISCIATALPTINCTILWTPRFA